MARSEAGAGGMMTGSGVDRPLQILQVNSADIAGGAEKVAWNLFQAYRRRGHRSWLAVGRKRSADPDVLCVPGRDGAWFRVWQRIHKRLRPLETNVQDGRLLSRLARRLSEPGRFLDERLGREVFRFPGTRALLQLTPERPDIVHCHNLHDAYFDLRTLPWLSRQVPVVLTLHDAWLLSGHCAHSFDCARWKIGCGHCPDLSIYPAVRRDATAHNWRRKRRIYARSRLYVASPSRWLMKKVEESMLAPGVVEGRVIPNGVDVSVFHPADRQAARAVLQLPPEVTVLLFIAHRFQRTPWKDYPTLQAAVARVAGRVPSQKILFVALGEEAPAARIGDAEVRLVPFEKDPERVARYYQAADVYVHAARAEAWGLTITEALACGIPVVATAVGGIPEQVTSLRDVPRQTGGPPNGLDRATGVLVPPGDIEAMAEAVATLLENAALRRRLGENASRDAVVRFGLDEQITRYLAWYAELLIPSVVRDTPGATPVLGT
jgi:glycosyltransferase involved in cell wall biosynthesis